jgi:hypothetical protein
MFIIRNQGFFYTDEYFDPTKTFKQVVKKTFKTKAEADKACAALARKWLRSETIGDYVFDMPEETAKLKTYLSAEWPDEPFDFKFGMYQVKIPNSATDQQLDEIITRRGVTFAQVFEVKGDAEESDGDDELHYGPSR